MHTIDVFRKICECAVYTYNAPAINSVCQIAERLNISEYQARKHINRLRNWDLIERVCYGGWSLTVRGIRTKINKKVYEHEVNFLNNLILEVNDFEEE